MGFRSVNQYDYSRTFPRYDLEGNLSDPPGVRPIQTSLWYPAVRGAHARRMPFSHYVWLLADGVGFPQTSPATRAFGEKAVRAIYGTPPDRYKRELNAPTNAVEDAAPAKGRFPVVVYGPSVNAPSFENSVLCEYLASYGYLVVASPSLGAQSRTMTLDLTGAETQARDMEFLISSIRSDPQADMGRLAVMGFSWGGLSEVLVKMRNDGVKAVVCLDGSIRYYPGVFHQSPDADPDRMNVPFLYLARRDDSRGPLGQGKAETAPDFYDSLRYSEAYLLTFHRLLHPNFASNFIKLLPPAPRGLGAGTQPEVNQGYQDACRYVRNFLDAYVKHDRAALAFLQNTPERNGITPREITRTYKAALPPPPTIPDLARDLRRMGPDRFLRECGELPKKWPGFTLSEWRLSDWGSELAGLGDTKGAVAVFTLDIVLHPEAADAYAGRAAARAQDGDKGRAVALDPQDEASRERLQALETAR